MIDYQTYCQIRLFHQERGLSFSQIGSELGIDPETAAKYSALTTYVKKNLLAGLDLPNSLSAINTAGRHWLATVANIRPHKETRQQPAELFATNEHQRLRWASLP